MATEAYFTGAYSEIRYDGYVFNSEVNNKEIQY